MRGQSIRVSAEKLGLKDHREISQSLRELILSSGIKKNEIADLTLERIEHFAGVYLKESNRRFWGPTSQPLPWPEQENRIKPHIVEILLRQKENQIDIRNRLASPHEDTAGIVRSRGQSEESVYAIDTINVATKPFVNSRKQTQSPVAPGLRAYTSTKSVSSNIDVASCPATEASHKRKYVKLRLPRGIQGHSSDIPTRRTPISQVSLSSESNKKRAFDALSDSPIGLETSINQSKSSRRNNETDLVDLTFNAQYETPHQNSEVHSNDEIAKPQQSAANALEGLRAQKIPTHTIERARSPPRLNVSEQIRLEVADLTYTLDSKALPNIVQTMIDRMETLKLEQRRKMRDLSGEDAALIQGHLAYIRTTLAELVTAILDSGGRQDP